MNKLLKSYKANQAKDVTAYDTKTGVWLSEGKPTSTKNLELPNLIPVVKELP
jgi:hypothetical protein